MWVQTGYDEIDDLLIALRPGGPYSSGSTGVGKTSFTLSLVQYITGTFDKPSNALFFHSKSTAPTY